MGKNNHNSCKELNDCNITEKDFFPPEDNRLYKSGVDDIDGGDNFEDYVIYFWETCEDEIYDL